MTDESILELGTQPVSESAPAGENIRYEPEFDLLEEEIAKLASPAGHTVNWTDVVDTSVQVLKERSKDLTVACYLTRALFEKRGIGGVGEGFQLIKLLIENFWEPMFPPVNRLRARAGAIEWLAEQLKHPIEIAKPTPAVFPVFKDVFQTVKDIEDTLDNLMGDSSPNIVDMRNALKTHVQDIERHEKLKADEEKRRQKAEEAKATAAQAQQIDENQPVQNDYTTQANPDNDSGSVQPAPQVQQNFPVSGVTISTPQTTAVPASADAAATSIRSNEELASSAKSVQHPLQDIANYLRNRNLADPLPYSLYRQSAWLLVTQLPMANEGVTPLREVPAEKIQQYKSMLDSGNYHALIPAVEKSFLNSPFWLDAHRIVATALEALGKDFQAARRAVIDETALFIHRYPALLDLKFSEGTPFADELTRLWIQDEVLTSSSSGSAEHTGSATGGVAAPWEAVAKKAQSMASKGKFEDGIKLLREGMASASSIRERTYWELQQAVFCAKAGHYSVAISQLEHLDDLVLKLGLEDWEPELSLEIARVYLMCHDKLLAKKNPRSDDEIARASTLKKRMCRLDVLSALSAAQS